MTQDCYREMDIKRIALASIFFFIYLNTSRLPWERGLKQKYTAVMSE
jgi:hypothetical protein